MSDPEMTAPDMSDPENRFTAMEKIKEQDIEDLESEEKAQLFRSVENEIEELSKELEEKIAKAREVQKDIKIDENTVFDDENAPDVYKEIEKKLEVMESMKISFDELKERVRMRAVMAEEFPEEERFAEYLENLIEVVQAESTNPEDIDPSDVYEE